MVLRRFSALGLALVALAAVAEPAPPIAAEWAESLAEFRADRERRLRDPDGWLTLAGLFWLEPGPNRFGSDPDAEVFLSAAGVPSHAGTLTLDGESVTLETAPGAKVLLGGEPVLARRLAADADEGGPDLLEVGRLKLYVIRRGERFGVRVKDPAHPALAAFEGLDFYDPDPAYRFEAAYRPFATPRPIEIQSVIGTSSPMLAGGEVVFTLNGREHRLLPLVSDADDSDLWFIFKDATSGKETYGFRYLSAVRDGDRVDLDFNRAYNPPCAFTPHATCPLPPRENRLDARIEAGERIYRP